MGLMGVYHWLENTAASALQSKSEEMIRAQVAAEATLLKVLSVALIFFSLSLVVFTLTHMNGAASAFGMVLGSIGTLLSRDIFLYSKQLVHLADHEPRYFSFVKDEDAAVWMEGWGKIMRECYKDTILLRPLIELLIIS